MEFRRDSQGKEFVVLKINNVEFRYADTNFRCFEMPFTTHPAWHTSKDITFIQAQLAFRGYSPRGNDINALKTRLGRVYHMGMDSLIKQGKKIMSKEWDRRQQERRQQKREAAAKAQALQEKWANRVISRRLAKHDPDRFLFRLFCDRSGKDEGGPPIELENLDAGYRSGLHRAAERFDLFSETSVSGVMVIGSSKNALARERLAEINRANGWPPERYEEAANKDHDEDNEHENSAEQEDEDEESDEADEDDSWDISGSWELECPDMAAAESGQSGTYTLDIYSVPHKTGKELVGRFNFGEFKGLIRFSSRQKKDRRDDHYNDDVDEFILDDDDNPSDENPTRYYRWRGKDCQGIIQLGSDAYLYEMTFSDDGRAVKGTWGTHDSDPGDVRFKGVKITNEDALGGGKRIIHEWNRHNQAAYDKANRDRWRR